MAWVPSHTTLARHPKLKRASRLAGCSDVQMIGHLHLLWWWALELAPDGDLSPYDVEDIADAASWQGDADAFVRALIDCGPGDAHGFLEPDMRLHDWEDYGGRYSARVESARKAAKARWDKQSPDNADAMRSQSDTHASRNTDESRGEEIRADETESKRRRKTSMRHDWQPDSDNVARLKAKFPKVDVDGELETFRDHFISKGETRLDWDASLRTWIRNAETYRQRREGEKPGGWR